MTITLGSLSERFELAIRGDPNTKITGLASIEDAGPGDLVFLFNSRYRAQLDDCAASAVCLSEKDAEDLPHPLLIASRPRLAWARIATLFDGDEQGPGVHPSAVVDPSVELPGDVAIGPNAVIAENVVLGTGVTIGAGANIGPRCQVGRGTILHANTTLYRETHVGADCIIHANAVIGADGFGFEFDPDQAALVKIPQIYAVEIGDKVEIGAGTTIDRGALKNTVIGDGVKIDNQVQIGHGTRVGAHTVISGCTAIAGSTTIGNYCMIGGAVGIIDNIRIVDQVQITAMTLVSKSIDQPGRYSSGTGLMESGLWKKNAAVFKRLEQIYRQVRSKASVS